MKTAILTACWLSAVLGISITPVLAQTSNQVPHDVDCTTFMKTHGFLSRAQFQCGFSHYSDKLMQTARACAKRLDKSMLNSLLMSGMETFDRNEKERGHDQICEAILNDFAGMVGESQHMELEKLITRVRELLDAGKFQEAVKSATLLEEKALQLVGPDHKAYVTAIKGLSIALMQDGRYQEALPWHQKLLILEEQMYGSESSEVAETLHNLAELLSRTGQHKEAEPLFRRALALQRKNSGSGSEQVAETITSLAITLMEQGDNKQAETLFNESLRIFQKIRKEAPFSAQIAVVYFDLGILAKRQGNIDDALTYFNKSIEVWEHVDGVNYSELAKPLREIGDVLLRDHKPLEATAYYIRALRISESNFGLSYPLTASLLDRVGRVTYTNAINEYVYSHGSKDVVENQMREYLGIRRRASEAARLSGDQMAPEGVDPREGANLSGFARHLGALNVAKLLHLEPIEKLDRESFEIGQLAIRSPADFAVRQMAVRFSREDSQLANAVREQQETLQTVHKSEEELYRALGSGNQQQIEVARGRKATLEAKVVELSDRIARAFPSYDAVKHTTPLSVENAQRILRDNEVLCVLFSNTFNLNVWVVTKDSFSWHLITDESGMSQNVDDTFIEKMVARFRRGLEFDKLADGKDELFDLGFSYELYHRLFGEIEAEVKDKHHLLIVPSGALTALPFQLLVTEKPPIDKPTQDQLKAYRDAAWIVKRHAITILPSVRSLESLRSLASKPWGPKTMIGFGDPVFDPVAVADKRGESAHRGLTGNADYTEFWKGADLDRDKLRHALGRLPDTAKELRDVAASLNVPSSDIHLGADASETTVKQAKLSDYRIIYFATHGLVAGDVKGVGEPSLALSLPSQPSDFDDGLLTASEIAQLKLNADWVVLSACNTIAGEKPGAEALSGLARAFFYAGARSLLVSHWAGESKATARIATKTFEIMTQKPGTGRAEALRLAMVDFLNDEKDQWNSYPAFWGAFSLIGGDRAPN